MSHFLTFASWICILSSFFMVETYDRARSRASNLLLIPAMRCLYVSAACMGAERLL
jgi:hypothetical protein